MPTTPLDLDALEKLYEQTTPGPWVSVAGDDHYIEAEAIPAEYPHLFKDDDLGRFVAMIGNRPADFGQANSEFIAAIHEHFPALIAAARTLKNLRDGQECDGFRLVPVEPTEAMLDAAYQFPASTEDRMRKQYRAMLSAHEKGTK